MSESVMKKLYSIKNHEIPRAIKDIRNIIRRKLESAGYNVYGGVSKSIENFSKRLVNALLHRVSTAKEFRKGIDFLKKGSTHLAEVIANYSLQYLNNPNQGTRADYKTRQFQRVLKHIANHQAANRLIWGEDEVEIRDEVRNAFFSGRGVADALDLASQSLSIDTQPAKFLYFICCTLKVDIKFVCDNIQC
jgi:hypothetical protein